MSHSTVAHKWFHQIGNSRTKDNSYSSGNMFYDEKIIYSYGKHFALAIRFDKLVLFNSKGYSNSTSKHQGHTRNAIDTFTHDVMYVPFKDAYRFSVEIDQKDAFKCIDFSYFINEFEKNAKTGALMCKITTNVLKDCQSIYTMIGKKQKTLER